MQLQQLLTNRMLNGIEAMTGVVNPVQQLHIRFCMPRGGFVCVSAHDYRVGVNAVVMELLLEPFCSPRICESGPAV
jgi:C4-dicarboxylate-specific signal transduction histidine kinase